jgi:hypothetical protein
MNNEEKTKACRGSRLAVAPMMDGGDFVLTSMG